MHVPSELNLETLTPHADEGKSQNLDFLAALRAKFR